MLIKLINEKTKKEMLGIFLELFPEQHPARKPMLCILISGKIIYFEDSGIHNFNHSYYNGCAINYYRIDDIDTAWIGPFTSYSIFSILNKEKLISLDFKN